VRRTATSVVSAAAALLLAAGLAGCGSGSDTATTPAAKKSPTTSSAPASAAAESTGTALFTSMTDAMSHKQSAQITTETTIGAQQIRGAGAFRYAADDFGASLTMRIPGQGRMQLVILPEAFYLKLPSGSGLPQGKSWLEIPLTGSADNPFSRALGPLMEQMKRSFDPQESLGLLKASTTVRKAGAETVDGVATTKYVATVDLRKAADAADSALAQQYQALIAQGVTTFDYTVWVDGQNLPRKFVTAVPTGQGSVSVSGTYRAWGKPVTIKAPPKRLVAQFPSGKSGSGSA
jgi:hypothetical protein